MGFGTILLILGLTSIVVFIMYQIDRAIIGEERAEKGDVGIVGGIGIGIGIAVLLGLILYILYWIWYFVCSGFLVTMDGISLGDRILYFFMSLFMLGLFFSLIFGLGRK